MNPKIVTADTPSHRLVRKYLDTMKLHRTILDKEVIKTGVYRSQHQILMYLSENPNASQRDIAERYHVSTATIAVSLKKLEKGGYVNRIVDQLDNRYYQICLTGKGVRMVEKSVQYFKGVEDGMFAGFSQKEFEALNDFIDRVYNNLQLLLTATEREV